MADPNDADEKLAPVERATEAGAALSDALKRCTDSEFLAGFAELEEAGREFADMALRVYGGEQLAAALEVSRAIRGYALAAKPARISDEGVEPTRETESAGR